MYIFLCIRQRVVICVFYRNRILSIKWTESKIIAHNPNDCRNWLYCWWNMHSNLLCSFFTILYLTLDYSPPVSRFQYFQVSIWILQKNEIAFAQKYTYTYAQRSYEQRVRNTLENPRKFRSQKRIRFGSLIHTLTWYAISRQFILYVW